MALTNQNLYRFIINNITKSNILQKFKNEKKKLQDQQNKQTIKGQYGLNGAKINCAGFSKKIVGQQFDGGSSRQRHEYFVAGDTHNTVRFYEFSGEQQLNTFSNNTNSTVQAEVSAVTLSWEEKSIFSGSNRGIINVWDILSSKTTPKSTLKGHATSVNCFGLFPDDDNRIASGSYDTYIKLWDVRQKNNIGMLKHHTKQINSIDISPDCHYLISGSQDCSTKLWDMRYPQKVICTYSQHSAPVLKVKFNPQDCMFASCSMDRTAKYFRCEQNHYDYISSTELVSMPITAIDFNPEGTRLCTSGNDILKIWNMNKNGILVESIDSAWKGVQDILWCEKGIKGIASHGGNLSVWFCYLDGNKSQVQETKENQSKLPRIFKNPSIKKQSVVLPKNNKSRKSFQVQKKQTNDKEAVRNKQLQSVMNDIKLAMGIVNNIDETKKTKEKQEKAEEKIKKQQEKKILEAQKKQKLRLKKLKQREQKERREKQEREKLQREREQQQQMKQERLEALAKQRNQRQRILQQKLHETFQKNNNRNLQITLQPEILEQSSIMNLSTFMGDGLQKQKLMQIEMIGDFMKDAGKFQSVYTLRYKNVRPIIHLWKQGKVQNALKTLERADLPILYDCISAIIHNSKFKFGLTPDVACILIRKLLEIMHNKHSTYVKNSMLFLNEIVLIFKDELIKVKMFTPMTRVDLSREERMEKYDRLTDELLNTFKDQRLKKYALLAKTKDGEELYDIAQELYTNLQEILRKIMPRKQPEPAT